MSNNFWIVLSLCFLAYTLSCSCSPVLSANRYYRVGVELFNDAAMDRLWEAHADLVISICTITFSATGALDSKVKVYI